MKRKIDNRDYKYYVLVGTGIASGWEFKSDAVDASKDMGPVQTKVSARATLKRLGIDPSDNANWLTGATWPTTASKNPSMTYGVMPAYSKFVEEYEEEVGRGKKYPMNLKGEGLDAAEGTRFDQTGRQTHDVDSLYIGVVELLEKWEDGGSMADEAGSLASGILGTLGFEWI